jgi:hypothetical protein
MKTLRVWLTLVKALLVGAFLWLALWTLTPRSLHAQDNACSHPIPPQAWDAMTPDQRKFQQVADSFTHSYIFTVLGPGPYPECLYQSVRDYFVAPAGASPEERERARARRERALKLTRALMSVDIK